MKRLLVTGGAGFIGSNFIHNWIENYLKDSLADFDALTYAGTLENLKGIDDSSNYRFVRLLFLDGVIVLNKKTGSN